MPVTPTQDDVQIALRDFLIAVLPEGVDIFIGVQNRVPETRDGRFVIMVPLRMTRLRTNVDSSSDTRFVGSALDDVMTVTEVDFGAINIGATIFGVGVLFQTVVLSQPGGAPGGVGSYLISKPQSFASQVLAAGQKSIEVGTEVVVQLDFHSANNTASDLAQTVAAAFRDPYGVDLLKGTGVVPLYADDPRYVPFINENQQYEWRWVLETHMQINPIVTLPQQYADDVEVPLNSVEASFPSP